MTTQISNSDNIIDSRDVIARIAELEELQGQAVALATSAHNRLDEVPAGQNIPDTLTAVLDGVWERDGEQYAELDGWGEDEAAELQALKSLADEGEGCSDWADGAALINEDYFEDYARELADDIGATKKGATWPNNHIDWEAAADELKSDYTTVEFDGNTYYIRD